MLSVSRETMRSPEDKYAKSTPSNILVRWDLPCIYSLRIEHRRIEQLVEKASAWLQSSGGK
jgi:hypothetical protein